MRSSETRPLPAAKLEWRARLRHAPHPRSVRSVIDEFSNQTCRRCGWTGLTQARQVRIGVLMTLTLLFIALSLFDGPRWLLWLAAALGFVAIAATPEVCPSCHAGAQELTRPTAPSAPKPPTNAEGE